MAARESADLDAARSVMLSQRLQAYREDLAEWLSGLFRSCILRLCTALVQYPNVSCRCFPERDHGGTIPRRHRSAISSHVVARLLICVSENGALLGQLANRIDEAEVSWQEKTKGFASHHVTEAPCTIYLSAFICSRRRSNKCQGEVFRDSNTRLIQGSRQRGQLHQMGQSSGNRLFSHV